jgi:diguanylate cyclase
MTAYDPSLHADRKGILAWLGLGRDPLGDLAELSALAQQLRAIAPGSRGDVIASIAEFLGEHDLDICNITLGAAFDYVTASDTLLVRLIEERELIGQPITADWLRKVRCRNEGEGDARDLHRTFERLEKHLVEFGEAASAARKATQDYGTSLEGQAQQLHTTGDIAASVGEILAVVRQMIDRTAEMEQEMTRSEEQSASLRKNLEAAMRSAEEDFLTGLPNRRAFEKTFEREYREALQAHDPLVVAFCDIDHFKRINDTHGHETGDRVLKAVARNLSGISSERCYIARHGGEEFVVLFRGRTLDEAKSLLDAARIELAERRMVNRLTKTPIGHVTFSAGVADVFGYPDRRAALKAADSALYAAKGKGRNQVVAA